MGLELSTIRRGLESLALVPGRFEIVPNTAGILVVIDFAHTAAAFREVLGFLRTVAQGRIVAMFGCAGDRDRTKRPVIGELVASLADFVIVTTDNPASEDPADIAEEVLAGVRRVDPQGERHLALLDRREAVRRAIALARPGDLVLLAGKGHEQVQIVDGARVPYSDRATVEEVLGARAEAPAAAVAPLPPAG
jgi:UDP-N-acetylmuramoyl-L-alanyl-D-glutamate--2,6-diaminopimelate ligase